MMHLIAMIGGIGPAEMFIIVIIVGFLFLIPLLLLIILLVKLAKSKQSPGPSNRLRNLEKLKQEGLITENEFEQKRQDIINSI